MLHIVGMDMIHGTWDVLFNLYLLALFEPTHGVVLFGQHIHAIEFVGLRLAIGAIASGIGSVPAGLISDRIGRKASFIVGDGVGALVSLLNVLLIDPVFLLCTPVVSSLAGSLHHVSETAFMAENSEARERVHLFSVGGSLSTAVGIVGSLIAASYPAFVTWFGGQLAAYRAATMIGVALWFLSLIPALLLREQPRTSGEGAARRVSIGFQYIRHPGLVARLAVTGALLSVGYAAALPFMNVFFHEHLHADEAEIGTTFATASLFVAVGSLFAPLVSSRLGKVRGVTIARLAAVPVVLSLGLSPEASGEVALGLTAAGVAIALRAMLMTISLPIAEAFAMEVLDPSERATMVGVESAISSLLRAGATVAGSIAIASGDYFLPFAITAACYITSTGLFWFWFRDMEPGPSPVLVPAST
jgi:MFS family permease